MFYSYFLKYLTVLIIYKNDGIYTQVHEKSLVKNKFTDFLWQWIKCVQFFGQIDS